MKTNQNTTVNIEKLKSFEPMIKKLLSDSSAWSSLDVDYHPPRVERLFINHEGYRIYLHLIHTTNEDCLFHKHNWPAALKQVWGSYEMGISYSEKEISSDEAYSLPIIAKFIINEGSYYEMTQTDALHYVRPITPYSLSIMLTKEKYPEHEGRGEAVDRKLNSLNDKRIQEILELFKEKMGVPKSIKKKRTPEQKALRKMIMDPNFMVYDQESMKRLMNNLKGTKGDDVDMDDGN